MLQLMVPEIYLSFSSALLKSVNCVKKTNIVKNKDIIFTFHALFYIFWNFPLRSPPNIKKNISNFATLFRGLLM